MSFCVWLICLGVIHSRFILMVACIRNSLLFFFFLFPSELCTQPGAWIHNPKIKSCIFHWLSQSSAPRTSFLFYGRMVFHCLFIPRFVYPFFCCTRELFPPLETSVVNFGVKISIWASVFTSSLFYNIFVIFNNIFEDNDNRIEGLLGENTVEKRLAS